MNPKIGEKVFCPATGELVTVTATRGQCVVARTDRGERRYAHTEELRPPAWTVEVNGTRTAYASRPEALQAAREAERATVYHHGIAQEL